MNNTNYEDKYLKYKNKYLQTKEILEGGVKIPKLGFQQHDGECWNDTLSTLLLYNHTTGDIIQDIFNNFTIEQIFEKIDKNISSGKIPSCFFPINIEETNKKEFDYFVTQSKIYIENMYNRYKNELLKVPKLDSQEKPILIPGIPQRECSYDESINSVKSILDITNINNMLPIVFDIEEHGADYKEYVTIINIANCFLINFDIDSNPGKPLQYLYYKYFNLDQYYFEKIDEVNRDTIISINNHIDEIITILKGDTYGIRLHIRNNTGSHVVGIFNGDHKSYFYDDNGVDDYPREYIDENGRFIIPIKTYMTIKSNDILIKKFEYIKFLLNQNILESKTFKIEENSKDELINKVTNIFKAINLIFNGYKYFDEITQEFKKIPEKFKSDTVGMKYIMEQNYEIRYLAIIMKSEYVDEKQYYLNQDLFTYITFNNNKAVQQIINYMDIKNIEYYFDISNMGKNFYIIAHILENYQNININQYYYLYNILEEASPDKNINSDIIRVLYAYFKRKDLDINEMRNLNKHYLSIIYSYYIDLDLLLNNKETLKNKEKKELYLEIMKLILKHPKFRINYRKNNNFVYLKLLNNIFEKKILKYEGELKYKKVYQYIELLMLLYSDAKLSHEFRKEIEEDMIKYRELFKSSSDYVKTKINVLSGGVGPIDDFFEKLINKIFGIKPKEDNHDNHDNHDYHKYIAHDDHKKHIKLIKKHTEIESETEGFEHGHH